MTVAGKLTTAFGVLLVLLGANTAYQINATRRAVSTGFALARIFDRLERSAARQLDELDRMEETASKLAVTADTGYEASFEDARQAFGATLARGDSLALAPAERREQRRLRRLWQRVPAQADSFEAAVRAARPDTPARLAVLLQTVSALRVQSRRLGDAARAAIRSRLDRSASVERQAERMALGFALGALLLSIVVAAWIVRSIAEPLRRLSEATHRVADGHFDYRFEVPRDQQFGRMARDFNLMTERLGELDRMKQQFLSRASHDLKTPLASMQETSRVLLDGVAGPLTADQRRLLQLSYESGGRLSAMIAKILDLSALEAGMRGGVRIAQDLRPLVRQAADLSSPALAQRGVALASRVPDDAVVAECDGDGVLRVLNNLLENAGRFSPEGSTVRVVLGVTERGAAVSVFGRRLARGGAVHSAALLVVEDAGPGVPDSDKGRIFDPFVQASNAGRRGRGGVGLGLAICREIVHAHHGRIWVEDAPGGGSRFVVALPSVASTPIPATR